MKDEMRDHVIPEVTTAIKDDRDAYAPEPEDEKEPKLKTPKLKTPKLKTPKLKTPKLKTPKPKTPMRETYNLYETEESRTIHAELVTPEPEPGDE